MRKAVLIYNPHSGLATKKRKKQMAEFTKYSDLFHKYGYQVEVYKTKYHGHAKEIVKNLNEDIDLVIGGPPCQAFSTAGKREGFNDSRGNVFLTFIDRILGLRPKFAVIENVRGLLSAPYAMEYPDTKAFGYATKTPENEKGGALLHIINLLEAGGYKGNRTDHR